jgi:hypothetical protein
MQAQTKLRLWLLLSLIASAASCLYMSRILLPWEYYIDVTHGRQIAELGDLYPRWVGTRELLLHGRNPYGSDVSHEIQMAFYGHAVDQSYAQPRGDIFDEQRFAYPLFVVLLMAPTAWMDFSHLQLWAPIIFAILTAISVPLWLGVLRWRPPKVMVAALVLFVLSSPQVMQGLRLRQLGLLVGFLLALSAWCIARNHLAIAGILLAVSTVKPQMVVLPLAWFLFWSASAWPRRWPLLAGFSITLATLVGLGELILPGWPRYFIDGLAAYRHYVPVPAIPLLCIALGNWVGGALSGVVMIGLLALAWRNRQVDAASPEFVHTLVLFLVGAILILPLLVPFNQILLLLPALMIFRDWAALPRLGRRALSLILAWPWIVSLVLLLHPPRLDSTNRAPLLPSATVLLLPFVLLFLLAAGSSRINQQHLPAKNVPLP